ncbi:MAG: altronate dehydratase [Verrucomicrobia bacterium]|nr:altronate dehydratase [Verrucomicrobiota bacterium]
MLTEHALAIQLNRSDDVVIACQEIPAETHLHEYGVTVRETVPAGHKIAIRNISAGAPVRRYNQIIGFASESISAGQHVHVQNLRVQTFDRDYAFCTEAKPTSYIRPGATFRGIVRSDGRVATRNFLGVLTTVNCSATVAKRIAEVFSADALKEYPNVDGVVAITHTTGCGMDIHGEGMEVLRHTLSGYARHVNFAGILVIGLGCEVNQAEDLFSTQNLPAGPLLSSMTIQESGGTVGAIRIGVERIREMLPIANRATRETVAARNLILGLQCGGSDGYSGITANPALGAAVDLLVRHGGTAILSETPEIYGAEHLLTRRAINQEIGEKLVSRIRWWEEYTARERGEMNNNPSPGNKAGGLTTILEKSQGAIAKGGTTNLVDVYQYAETVAAKGLVFMDTPGYDPVSATGQVAGGANLICFTTGRGSVYGCKPSPSLKLATSSRLYRQMADDMDINCGEILDGQASIQEVGERIFRLILETASGRRSRSEAHGFGAEEFVPWMLGAVM